MRTIVDINSPEYSLPPQNSAQPKPLKVEKPVPATDPSKMQIVPAYSDKYDHETETGRKFRALASARRYLNGEEEPMPRKRPKNRQIVPYQNAKVFKGVMYKGKVLRPDQLEEARYSNLEEIYPENLQFTNCGVLPDGWIIEFHPRANTTHKHIDKYFHEPGTGRKFRSLASVMRYLTGEEEPLLRQRQNNCLVPYQNSGVSRRVVYEGKVMRPDELEEARHSKPGKRSRQSSHLNNSATLPDGWIVEEVPRKDGLRKDRFYIDPVTGQRFRSAPDAHRFLEGQTYRAKRKALAISNYSTAPRNALPRKRSTSTKISKNSSFDLSNPPEKINWVYSGDGKDKWSPLVEECILPNYVQEQWSETFMLGMTGWKRRVPQLTMKEDNLASNA